MDIRQEILLKRDKYATLACVALNALEAPFREDDEINFPDLSPELLDATHNVLEALFQDGHINSAQAEASYIEPMCLEHGVVHVHVCDPASSLWHWLEIDPMTGLVYRY